MKTKSILIVASTLIIGFIIGFLANGFLTRQKFESFVRQGSHDAFKFRMMDIIHPDESQVKDIEPILEDFAREAHQNIESSKEQMKVLHEELMDALKPYLNNDQLERLDRANERFREVWERPKGPPHSRPHGQGRYGPGR
ncbi:MAG: hypothetical protein K9H16_03275 [Bacteroidales bacterium]|nr:hypothetical protein [Bacteroidales bacterium]